MMGLLVKVATKLADSRVLRCCFRVLYLRGGGSCGGGLLSTLGGVTGFRGIVWTMGGSGTLGGVRAGSHCGDIISTLGSKREINNGVGGLVLGMTGADVCKSLEN